MAGALALRPCTSACGEDGPGNELLTIYRAFTAHKGELYMPTEGPLPIGVPFCVCLRCSPEVQEVVVLADDQVLRGSVY